MIVDRVQRWKDRRGVYRPAGEPIKTSEYEVELIPDDATAKAFVLAHQVNLELGLDAELIMDPETSDAERSALVADVVERYPGVVGFDSGPTVSLGDDGQIALSMVVLTEDGPFSLSL